jgi:hypothetical protein
MKLIIENQNLEEYTKEILPIINYSHPAIQRKIKEIQTLATQKIDLVKIVFEYCRDQISHSFDTGNMEVTINANDVLEKQEGICFSKTHLFATLLRGMNIPAGFCYQSVVRNGTIESGFALHGLNAVYLEETGWFRLDPRGNKPGVQSEFSVFEEKLAYKIHTKWGEIDYPNVYTKPLEVVIESMENSKNNKELFFNRPKKI